MHPKYEVEKTYVATLEGQDAPAPVCRRLVTHRRTARRRLDQARPLRDHRLLTATTRWSRSCCTPGKQPHRAPYLRLQSASRSSGLVRTQIGPIKLGDIEARCPTACCPQDGGPRALQGGRPVIRVAIDGPAGVGKSSTSKALARLFRIRLPRHGRHVSCLRLVVPEAGHRSGRRNRG